MVLKGFNRDIIGYYGHIINVSMGICMGISLGYVVTYVTTDLHSSIDGIERLHRHIDIYV